LFVRAYSDIMIHTLLRFVTGVLLISGIGMPLQAQLVRNPMGLLKEKRHAIYGLDNRRSWLYGESVLIYGVFGGVGFDDHRLRIKGGVAASARFAMPVPGGPDTLSQWGRMAYVSIGEEMELVRHRKWSGITYFNAGVGYLFVQPLETPPLELQPHVRHMIIPIEVGAMAGYDVTDYLMLKAGGGWRFMPTNDDHALDGFFLKVGALFRWEVAKAHFRRDDTN
jgi:hypothetical protein